MPQSLYMLIGPKGSGKTHIGILVQEHTDIRFIRVEPIWLQLQPEEIDSLSINSSPNQRLYPITSVAARCTNEWRRARASMSLL